MDDRHVILDFVKAGFKVFPLKPNEKVPVFRGWQDWAQGATEHKVTKYLREYPKCNWGVYCGASGLVVVDVDNKKGRDGSGTLRGLEGENSVLPETLRVRTTTGGFHYYFLGERGSKNDVARGIDVKSKGGYVVAPGSFIDGLSYDIVDKVPIAPVPDWVVELVPEKKEPVNVDEVILPDGSRNESLMRLGCAMRGLGMSYEGIAEGLRAENFKKCDPPLEESEVDSIALSVSRYTPELAKAVEEFEVATDVSSRPVHISVFSEDPPPRKWLVQGWLPSGEVSSLYGSGGSGKSLLALQLAGALASGGCFLGLKTEKKIPCICVFCEDSRDEIHRRLHAIKQAPEYEFLQKGEAEDMPVFVWPRVGMNNDIARMSDKGNDLVAGVFKPVLEDALKKMKKGEKLLILDTLSDVYMGDEISRAMVSKFVKTYLGRLAIDHDLTILVLAHPSKSSMKSGDHYSGSTAWDNAVRNRLAFLPHKKHKNIMLLKRMKSNYAKRGEEVMVRYNGGLFTLCKEPKPAQTPSELLVLDKLGVFIEEGTRAPLVGIAKDMVSSGFLERPDLGVSFKTDRKLEQYLANFLSKPQKHKGVYYEYKAEYVIGSSCKRWVVSRNIEDKNLMK